MKNKRNWHELRLEYMTSPILEVAAWGRLKLGSDKAVRSGNFLQQTKYWRQEKEQYLQDLRIKSEAEFFNQRKEALRRRLDKVFDLLDRRLGPNSSIRELQIALQMLTSINAIHRAQGQTDENTHHAQLGLLDAMKKASEELGLEYTHERFTKSPSS